MNKFLGIELVEMPSHSFDFKKEKGFDNGIIHFRVAAVDENNVEEIRDISVGTAEDYNFKVEPLQLVKTLSAFYLEFARHKIPVEVLYEPSNRKLALVSDTIEMQLNALDVPDIKAIMMVVNPFDENPKMDRKLFTDRGIVIINVDLKTSVIDIKNLGEDYWKRKLQLGKDVEELDEVITPIGDVEFFQPQTQEKPSEQNPLNFIGANPIDEIAKDIVEEVVQASEQPVVEVAPEVEQPAIQPEPEVVAPVQEPTTENVGASQNLMLEDGTAIPMDNFVHTVNGPHHYFSHKVTGQTFYYDPATGRLKAVNPQ